MAVFPSFNLTKKGEELLNRSIGEGRVLTFTKFKIGDGVPTGDWRDLDNLQSSFKEFPVLETAIQADQVLRIRGYFDNKGFGSDKRFKEIGVFVTLDGVAGEHLYSYTNAGDTGDVIPAESRGFYSRTLDVNNYIGYATNITFNIEQTRDNYDFNTENELKVATFLKKGDKVRLWGRLVLGDIETLNYIVTDEVTSFILDNGLYCKLAGDKGAFTVENDLINLKGAVVGDVVEVLGFHAKGDGSHHKRVAKSADDGSGEQGQDGIWWCIVHKGEVNVSWFGAKGDGVTDDSEYFKKASTYCYRKYIILCGEKEYLVSSELDFKQVPLNITGIFNNTVPLILGGQSQGFVDYNSKQYINRCNDVIIIGAKKQEIELVWAGNIVLKAYSSRGVNAASIAYSTFVFHYTKSIKLLGDVAGDNQAWINENKFYLNDCKLFQIGNEDNSDNYIHNHNIIYGGTFEGGGESIKLYRCHSNMFYNLRLEGRTKIVFSELSKWNVIKYSFVSSDTYLTTLYPIIVGNKSTNKVINEYCDDLRTIREYNVNQFNIQEYVDSEKTTTGSVLPDGRVSLGAWGYFYSDFVEADKFTKFSAFVADGRDSGDGFRCGFETYDSNFNKISGTGYKMLVGGVGFVDSEQTAETNQHTHYVQSVDEYMKNQGNVKYIRFYSRASNCRGFNIGFKIETLNTGGKNDAIVLEGFRKPKPISTQLDTPYYSLKMQQEGIYEDYINYRDELHEYENSQTTDETMLLPVLQEPVIPESVKAFAEKYKLI